MKRMILTCLCLLVGYGLIHAQKKLWREVDAVEVGTLNDRERDILNLFKKNDMVADFGFVAIDLKVLSSNKVTLEYDGVQTIATESFRENHDLDPADFSWFGTLSDQTGVFFTVVKGQLASKFYMGNIPVLIIPFRDNLHLLVRYTHKIDQGICGLETIKEKGKDNAVDKPKGIDANRMGVDDVCVMRVLWVVTSQAEPEIAMSLELAARMLQDETNLAYAQSIINYRMEMARVLRTTYAETTTNTNASAYGTVYAFPSDLINLSTGAGLLSAVPTTRNLYQADVVVMVRSQATSSAQGLYGVAYGVPEDPSALNAGNAFALISTQYMIGGRFTFAHEIGHIQGARHDNHSGSPVYARGYLFSAAATDNRTIMAVGGSCNPPTGCRIQYFSNPSLSYLGTPIGIAGQRDNVLRINNTGQQVKNFRITSDNLIIPAETYDDEILARHLATQTITTNNNTVTCLAGSRVTYRAGTTITLTPGFSVNLGAIFNGYTGILCDEPATTKATPGLAEVEKELKEAITVYPNPTTGILNIALRADANSDQKGIAYQAYLYNMMGQLMENTSTGTNAFDLDLSTYPQGTYYLVIYTPNGQRHTQKVVKQ